MSDFDHLRSVVASIEEEADRKQARHEATVRALAGYRDDLEAQVAAAVAIIATQAKVSPQTASDMVDAGARRGKVGA